MPIVELENLPIPVSSRINELSKPASAIGVSRLRGPVSPSINQESVSLWAGNAEFSDSRPHSSRLSPRSTTSDSSFFCFNTNSPPLLDLSPNLSPASDFQQGSPVYDLRESTRRQSIQGNHDFKLMIFKVWEYCSMKRLGWASETACPLQRATEWRLKHHYMNWLMSEVLNEIGNIGSRKLQNSIAKTDWYSCCFSFKIHQSFFPFFSTTGKFSNDFLYILTLKVVHTRDRITNNSIDWIGKLLEIRLWNLLNLHFNTSAPRVWLVC